MKSFDMVRLWQDIKGVALLEFAIVLPFLILLFAGLIELSNYIFSQQKSDSASYEVANYVSQLDTPLLVDINKINSTLNVLLDNYVSMPHRLIVSGVVLDVDGVTAKVSWQKSVGAAIGSSSVGVVGGAANIGTITLNASNELIVVEVLYKHTNLNGSWGSIGSIFSSIQHLNNQVNLSKTVLLKRMAKVHAPRVGVLQPLVMPGGCCSVYCTLDDGGSDMPYKAQTDPFCNP
jgi:Flp pilus assembly protein TadG